MIWRGKGEKMIISVKNEKVKAWKKLHRRKERIKTNTFLIEGDHLLNEAYASGWEIKEIIALNNAERPEWTEQFNITWVSEEVLKEISQTITPQGMAAVIEMKDDIKPKGDRFLLVDAIQDPGNLGTIIRTADAAGFDGVMIGEGTVDLYNDKVIRATQGSLFHLPVVQTDLNKEIMALKEKNVVIWATALEGAVNYKEVPIPEKVAIIVGNEGAGVQSELLQKADEKVKIPIYGKAESLNVAIAAGVFMYYVKG